MSDITSQDRPVEAPLKPDGPNENTFWEDYSPHYEFPTSLVSSFFIMGCLFALAALMLYFMKVQNDRVDLSPVPMMGVDGGMDDGSDGMEGGGGVDNPIAIGNFAPTVKDFEQLPQITPIPEVTEDIRKKIAIDDPNGTTPISDEKLAQFAALDKALRDKMLGMTKGATGGTGTGDGPPKPDGNGGVGANSTQRRSLRWILRFRTTDGRDYLNQLSGIGATILVPLPPDNKKAYIFRDLAAPKLGEFVSEEEWKRLDSQIRFCDFKRDSVSGVASALNLDFTPHSFWAFFPKGIEEELSRKEVAYANRRAEDIEETVFEVVVRGGRPTINVAVQKLKR